MKLSFKFFLWGISVKTQKLGEEEKIKFLANELIKSVQASGRTIALPHISEGFGSLDIHLHNFHNENSELTISNAINKWEIKANPTFKTLEVEK